MNNLKVFQSVQTKRAKLAYDYLYLTENAHRFDKLYYLRTVNFNMNIYIINKVGVAALSIERMVPLGNSTPATDVST